MGDHHQELQRMSGDSGLELPPGFRFYPSDEEIITFYLKPKVHQRNFTCSTIGEVDLNRTEPWELPGEAKTGEKEWYFFFKKDRKYPTGVRTNRASPGGYWKATGKDKEINMDVAGVPLLVGMKKTLVFYEDRAPRGKKTDWVMHEFRLEGSNRLPRPSSSSTSTSTVKSPDFEGEWVVCRVFHRITGIKKAPAPPSYNLAMADGGIDQSSIPMPMPLQFPMLSNFTMDPIAPYYSTAGVNSSLVLPMMPPMADMGYAGLQMNNIQFGNPMAIAPSMSYHQMENGEVGTDGFMAAPESFDQTTAAAEILSMVFAAPESMATMDMDNIWDY